MAMKQQTIPLTGGLELVSDKLSVAPGTAQFMMNYEIANQNGPRRVDGFSKYDGRYNFSGVSVALRASPDTVDASPTSWTVGQVVQVEYMSPITGLFHDAAAIVTNVVDSLEDEGWDHVVTVVLTSPPADFPADPAYINNITGYGYSGVLVYFETDNSDVYAAYADLVEQLPGNSTTRIPGLHFFNDRLYAIVDCVAIEVTGVSGITTQSEGANLYVGSLSTSFGTVARVRDSATPGNMVWELVDYNSDVALTAGADIYWPVESGNLVENGTFTAVVVAEWTAGAGWVISSGVGGVATATTANTITSSLAAEAGYAYELTYTITRSAGSIRPSFGGINGTVQSASGTFTDSIIATSTAALSFNGLGAFSGTLDNVSVRKVARTVVVNGAFTGAGTSWTFNAGWAWGSDRANATASSNTLVSSLAGVSGRTYRITYTVVRSAGTVTVSIGGVSGTARASSATYIDYITASGAGALTFTGSGFTGSIDDVEVVLVQKLADYVGVVDPLYASMYYTDWDGAGGWTGVNLGRELSYTEATASTSTTAFFLPYLPSAFIDQIEASETKSTDWIGADSWENVNGNGPDWGAGASATDLAEIDTIAVSTAAGNAFTDVLIARWSEDLIGIPAGATIMGIEIRIQRWATTGIGRDVEVRLGKQDDILGLDNKPSPEFFAVGSPGTLVTYGTPSDLWRLPLTADEINSGDLHLRLQVLQQGSGANNVSVDHIGIKVYYQEQARRAYIHNPAETPADQEIEVISYTVARGTEGGTPAGGSDGEGNRQGILTINPLVTETDVNKPWPIGVGLEIRTLPAGGGDLLAFTASDDERILFPSSYELAEQERRTRYTFANARPYARDDADVFFICNGITHAYMFEGNYALAIQTGLLSQFERPRHACWAGNYLALGYGTGTLAISDLGDPLVYLSTSSLAAEIGASDRVTGLLKLKGDSLGVFTESTIFALQGSIASEFIRIEIAPSSGAIEYTVEDIGQPVFCDYRGVATLSNTEQYGDFNRGRLSWQVTPWLIDRLQSNTRNQLVDKTLITAFAKRNKGQYCMVFRDGWLMTMTLDNTGLPHFTTQRWYADWEDRDATAIRVLGLTTGVTSTGQDLAFMSFDLDSDDRYRYVFQIDVGRSFDGEEIIAQWMGQPLTLGSAMFGKSLSQVGVYGRAFGYAALKLYASSNFSDPVSDETTSASDTAYAMVFGTTASSTEGNYKEVLAVRGEGEDFTFLFESISATESPHTLQAMVVRFETTEPKS